MPGSPFKKMQAAAAVKVALEHEGPLDKPQLRRVLRERRLWSSGSAVAHAIRIVRDAYGNNALISKRDPDNRRRVIYVLDPSVPEGIEWLLLMTKRARTECEHVLHVGDWLAMHFGNRGPVRALRRYMNNALAELDEIIEALTTNGSA